jgi:hypothetical protein
LCKNRTAAIIMYHKGMSTSSATSSAGRSLLALGIGLALLGVAGYIVQVWAQRLTAPWYMPILGTLGLLCVGVALWQVRNVWRMLALLLVMLVCGAEWAFLLATRQPDYTGPVALQQPFPAFATLRHDGTAFTQRDLQGDKDSVLVYFRGRW